MLSFSKLIERMSVEQVLRQHDEYLAHRPDERLAEHMQLVIHYFLSLVHAHQLEEQINKSLINLCGNNRNLAAFAKETFWKTILFHDFGKVNENFQRIKMNNVARFPEIVSNGIDTQHSILSAYIFLAHQLSNAFDILQNEPPEQQKQSVLLVFAFAYNIIKHHSAHLDDISNGFTRIDNTLCNNLETYLTLYNLPFASAIARKLPTIRSHLKFQKLSFEWFLLVRMNFSLLTAADYYATAHFYGQWKEEYHEFGTLTDLQKKAHSLSLQTTHPHNTALFEVPEKFPHFPPPHTLKPKSSATLNLLRSQMAYEVLHNTRSHSKNKLFYLEAPTGGGKTNMAFIACNELISANPEINKVFYVFPFTSLSTQTLKAAKETLNLRNNEYIELHSTAPWKTKETAETPQDGLYGKEKLDNIHNQFVNYPYTFLSHVRFFDILKSNDKSSIYLLHRLANSIVIIDEVQAYNPELWDKMAYLVNVYANTLNIRFIIMSATLPKIGALVDAKFVHLIPRAIDRFFVNPNFAQRVRFSDALLQRSRPAKEDRPEYMAWLLNEIFERCERSRKSNGRVHAIVEFIFKKSATEFAQLAETIFQKYQIYVLSGTILEPKRRQIVQRLKSKQAEQENILLITTQVVEAGVDIDMDIGFKNRSMIDSEEQLSGRVNRNATKTGCVVYLFDLDDPSVIYGKDRRYREMHATLKDTYFDILETKRFDLLYDKVKSWLSKTNHENQMAGTVSDYAKYIGQLHFPKIHEEFTLIEHANTNVFVPLNLPIQFDIEKELTESILTHDQLAFLSDNGILVENNSLSGSAVFELYKAFITHRTADPFDRNRNIKVLQSILAMFTFSLFSHTSVIRELIQTGNPEEFGFLYLERHKEVYDYDKGLIDNKFSELIFL